MPRRISGEVSARRTLRTAVMTMTITEVGPSTIAKNVPSRHGRRSSLGTFKLNAPLFVTIAPKRRMLWRFPERLHLRRCCRPCLLSPKPFTGAGGMADPVARDQASILYEPEEMIAASIAARRRAHDACAQASAFCTHLARSPRLPLTVRNLLASPPTTPSRATRPVVHHASVHCSTREKHACSNPFVRCSLGWL